MTIKSCFFAVLGVAACTVLACGLLAPTNSPRARKFDCQEAALRPVLGEILDTKDLLRALYAGQADLRAALAAAGATEAEVQGLVEALRACDGPPPAPSAEDPS